MIIEEENGIYHGEQKTKLESNYYCIDINPYAKFQSNLTCIDVK